MAADLVKINVSGDLAETGTFSTLSGEGTAERLLIFKAVNSAKNLRNVLAETKKPLEIQVQDIIMQRTEWADEATGEVTPGTRVLLVDASGEVYSSSSSVVAQRIVDLLGIIGHPRTWDAPVTLRFEERKGKGLNRFVTFDVI